MVTKGEVIKAQESWGKMIVRIGRHKENRAEREKITGELLKKLYAFEKGEILFKPTRAAEIQFRPDKRAARSYFIGGDEKYPEDQGFALQPWKKVRFENASIILESNRAIAIGNYYFTDRNDEETKVEYTLGYVKINGTLKIDVHHSSIPFRANT